MPFLYATMVGNVNPLAYDRLLVNYNFAGYPTAFFDGGDELSALTTPAEAYYQLLIEQCGARPVQNLSMVTALDWLGGGQVRARLRVGNGVPANTPPSGPPTPDGPVQALIGTGVSLSLTVTDNESDQMYCQWDWGDGQVSSWQGPYTSGQLVTESHQWEDIGDYDIRVRLLDVWNDSTDWSSPHAIAVDCCVGSVGNVVLDAGDDCTSLTDQGVDVSDLTNLIDHLFINYTPICCMSEADVAPLMTGGVPDGVADVSDLTAMIDHLFITYPTMPACP